MNTEKEDVLRVLSRVRKENRESFLTFVLCYQRVYKNNWQKDVWRKIWGMVCTPYFEKVYKTLSFRPPIV